MGNKHCCDDKNKGGDWNGSAQKVTSRQLQTIGTKDVEKSFENKKTTKNTLPSSNEYLQYEKEQNKNQNQSSPLSSWVVNSKKPEQREAEDNSNILEVSKSEKNKSILTAIPELNPYVRKTITVEDFFNNIEPSNMQIREYGGQIYEGQLQNNTPNGFGKFYKSDQSLYIGFFIRGKADGQGAFIFADGSYYKGRFQSNKAETEQGYFKSNDIQYKGAFKNNTFHGRGEEKGPNHEFRGQYSNGQKASGSMTWTQNGDTYTYEGTFNERGQFHGKGVLKEPTGTYDGTFCNATKHGFGTYKYNNLLCYQGEYVYNVRNGKGKLINPNQKIAYEGHFQNGLPHGEGLVYDKDGLSHMSVWHMGIDRQSLQNL